MQTDVLSVGRMVPMVVETTDVAVASEEPVIVIAPLDAETEEALVTGKMETMPVSSSVLVDTEMVVLLPTDVEVGKAVAVAVEELGSKPQGGG